MSVKDTVFRGIATHFSNTTFSTAKVAGKIGFRNEDVSSAISQLRNNDLMVKFVGIQYEGARAVRHYQLTDHGLKTARNRGLLPNTTAGATFAAATDAHNAQGRPAAPTILATRLAGLVAAVTPAKALKDFSDDELFNEVKRRVGG